MVNNHKNMSRKIIGITMGDPAGIGPEVVVKALNHKEIFTGCQPVVLGNKTVINDALAFIPSNLELNSITNISDAKGEYGVIDVLNFDNIELNGFKYGEVSPAAGKASVEYIFNAIDLALENKIAAVVTGPINKEAINAAGYNYAGHTEIFAERTGAKDYAMMLISEDMKVIHVSTHVSLREACDLVKKERVLKVIELANAVLVNLGISKPRIAVAGLNPHSGEQGLFGREEIDEIIPAIKEASNKGFDVNGPIPADTIFSKVQGRMYDIAVVMYHDQGHIPMKVTGFKYDKETGKFSSVSGVNTTVGLPIIRTSVDHGTAYDRAGEGIANEQSMVEAIKMAINLN